MALRDIELERGGHFRYFFFNNKNDFLHILLSYFDWEWDF